ncbi:MAG: glycosyltransferase [Thermodesulfobacteriota bacterium]
MKPVDKKTIIVCIPIYRDWESAGKLLSEMDVELRRFGDHYRLEVLLVDDGAEEKGKPVFPSPLQFIERIGILRMRRNLGHQRAIAIGLSYIHAHKHADAVMVMDGDGEDTVRGVATLITEFSDNQGRVVVFARRGRRTESMLFRIFYQLYKLLHWVLTGRGIQVGNFSILPFQHLECLVAAPELWNHYAASVIKLKLPCKLVPIDRGHRIAGKSSMNFIAFVIHGLSAISVYAEEVGVRLMVFCAIMIGVFALGLAGVISIRFFTDYAIPGWATSAFGLTFSVILQLLVISLIVVVITLKNRSAADFMPMRDFQYFIREKEANI